VAFCPVEDIYDRYDPDFVDTPRWQARRRAANRRVLALGRDRPGVIPYYFVWNDFDAEELARGYRGVKWHRHEDEPVYRYDDPRCGRFVRALIERDLPVVLEESLANTIRFVREVAPEATVVIPHLGMLNGGYGALEAEGIWAERRVWADSALASPAIIAAYLDRCGPDRLLFGSDHPFGRPSREAAKIRRLGLDRAAEAQVLGGNLRRLLGGE